MHYIIVDLEWNQPMSYQSQVFLKVGDKLIFEMIQIGAVKLDEELNMVDAVSIPIKPTHYVKIHPRIRKMTQLSESELASAPEFNAAMEQFFKWCGESFALLTWGCDDVSVWKQNVDFFQCPVELPPLYDIQRLYSEAFHLGKERKGLKGAMEHLELEPLEDKNFHNAVHDAYYTAMVFQKLPHPETVLKYINQPKKLCHVERSRRSRFAAKEYASIAAAFDSETARAPKCPMCGKSAVLEKTYVRQTGDKYVALANCPAHGPLIIRLRFAPAQGEKVFMSACVALASEQARAYVHTKQLAKGDTPDGDGLKLLREAGRSSMPFED